MSSQSQTMNIVGEKLHMAMTVMKVFLCQINKIDSTEYPEYEFDVAKGKVNFLELWKTPSREEGIILNVPDKYKEQFFMRIEQYILFLKNSFTKSKKN